MTTGIYGIFDRRNGECLYVGQSKSIEDRWRSHRKRLLGGRHLTKFTEWFQSQGADLSVLELRQLEETDNTDEAKNAAEIKWFHELSPRFYGKIPASTETWEHSKETREKISAGLHQHYPSPTYSCHQCGEKFQTRKSRRGDKAFCTVDCYRRFSGKMYTVDAETVRKLYYEDGLSLRKVGDVIGITNTVLIRYMNRWGMKRRPQKHKNAKEI